MTLNLIRSLFKLLDLDLGVLLHVKLLSLFALFPEHLVEGRYWLEDPVFEALMATGLAIFGEMHLAQDLQFLFLVEGHVILEVVFVLLAMKSEESLTMSTKSSPPLLVYHHQSLLVFPWFSMLLLSCLYPCSLTFLVHSFLPYAYFHSPLLFPLQQLALPHF